MSMNCTVLALSKEQIAKLLARPALTKSLTMNSSERSLALFVDRLPPDRRSEFVARRREFAARLGVAATASADVSEFGELGPALNLKKSWHILHYVFTGRADSAGAPGNELLSGEPIGPDVGYGPARVQPAASARAFSNFLEQQNVDVLVSRLNFSEMQKLRVYPIFDASNDATAGWDEDLRRDFPLLRDYLRVTTSKDNGLLIWLS